MFHFLIRADPRDEHCGCWFKVKYVLVDLNMANLNRRDLSVTIPFCNKKKVAQMIRLLLKLANN